MSKTFQEAKSAMERMNDAVRNIARVDPWVAIVMRDAVTYKLEFSWAATLEFFRQSGLTIENGDLNERELSNPKMMALAIYCGLMIHHPEITQDEVSNLISMRHRNYYILCISEAISAIQPDLTDMLGGDDHKEVSEVPDPLAAIGITLTSGPSVEPTE